MDARIRVVGQNLTYYVDSNKAAHYPQVHDKVEAEFASHWFGRIDYQASQVYDTYFFGNGSTTKLPLFLDSNDLHPTALGQEYWNAFSRAAFLLGLGDDDSNVTMKVDPSVDHVDLTAAASTATPTWAPKTRTGAPATGKTLTFSASDPSVTVNSAGVITGHADNTAGTVYVKCVSNDGGVGVVVVNCSGGGWPTGSGNPDSDNFNRTNNVTSLGATAGGVAWAVDGGATTVAGINANQAYFSTMDGTINDIGGDFGVADCTVAIRYANLPTGADMRVRFRCANKDNEIFASSQGANLQLFKKVGGSQSQIGTVAYTVVSGDIVAIKGAGNQISVYVNGVLKIGPITETAGQTTTRHGFGAGGGSDAALRFDDFALTIP
jgi:hypothetical protein